MPRINSKKPNIAKMMMPIMNHIQGEEIFNFDEIFGFAKNQIIKNKILPAIQNRVNRTLLKYAGTTAKKRNAAETSRYFIHLLQITSSGILKRLFAECGMFASRMNFMQGVAQEDILLLPETTLQHIGLRLIYQGDQLHTPS